MSANVSVNNVIMAIMLKRLGGKITITDKEMMEFDIGGLEIARWHDIAHNQTVILLREDKTIAGELVEDHAAIEG